MRKQGRIKIRYDPSDSDRDKVMVPYLEKGLSWIDSVKEQNEDGSSSSFWILAPEEDVKREKAVEKRKKPKDDDVSGYKAIKNYKEKIETLPYCLKCLNECKQKQVSGLTMFICYDKVVLEK